MQWVNITDRDSTFDLAELDVYANWSLGEGLQYLFPANERPKFFPLLIQLQDHVSPKEFSEGSDFLESTEDKQRWRSAILVPPAYTTFPDELNAFHQIRHLTALATADFFDIVRNPRNARARAAIKSISLSRPLRQRSISQDFGATPQRSELKLAGASPASNMIVVGIIDDGIAFGHERFRDGTGATRIEFVWVQDGDPPSPPEFGYGHELNKAAITGPGQLVDQCTHAGFFDEEEFYRLAQVGDFTRPDHKPVTWRAAHGTAVLDLATGADPGASPSWPIVCVQLPVSTTATTSGALLAGPVVDGIWYILLRSLAIARSMGSAALPVVINLSYGFTAGPHDGTHHIERAIDALVEFWQLFFNVEVNVVIASGNDHLSRVYAQAGFQAPSDVVTLPLRILPEDLTPSYVEVWLPHRATKFPSPIELSVITPDGLASPLIGQPGSTSWQLVSATGHVLCEAIYRYPPPTQRGMFLVTLSPTTNLDATGSTNAPSVAPSGTWMLLLKNISVGGTELVHAWIQRDDTPYGYPVRGRQSYFTDSAYRRFDEAGREIEDDIPGALVKRAGTINAMATGDLPVVIGGLLRKELRPARYSSGGPITPKVGSTSPSRTGPDALTISDDSRVLEGVLAAGTHNGSVIAWNGTSVAAPQITRFLADELAAGQPGGRARVCALAAADESTPLPPPKPSSERGGCGRIRRPALYPLRLR